MTTVPRRWRGMMVMRLAIIGVAAVVMLASCANSDDSSATHDALCEAAARWRVAAEQLEVVSNSVDRESGEGRLLMDEAFGELVNVTVPLAQPGTPEFELAVRMENLNTAAERFLSSSRLFFLLATDGSTSSTAQRVDAYETAEDARLAWNRSTRASRGTGAHAR